MKASYREWIDRYDTHTVLGVLQNGRAGKWRTIPGYRIVVTEDGMDVVKKEEIENPKQD